MKGGDYVRSGCETRSAQHADPVPAFGTSSSSHSASRAWWPYAVIVGIALSLASCATRPPQALSPEFVPKAFVGRVAAQAPVWPRTGWWREFGSPELSRLIGLAEKNNRDLAIAAARLREARAEVTIQRAALFPVFDLQAQGYRTGIGESALSINGQQDSTTRNSFGLGAEASYELDVSGLSRDKPPLGGGGAEGFAFRPACSCS